MSCSSFIVRLTPGGPGFGKSMGRGLPVAPMAGAPQGLAGPIRGTQKTEILSVFVFVLHHYIMLPKSISSSV